MCVCVCVCVRACGLLVRRVPDSKVSYWFIPDRSILLI